MEARVADNRGRGSIFIVVGAGLALIVLLALQSLTGTGLLRTRTETSTTTAAALTVPDAYQQVASAYSNRLLLLDARNVSALASGYESNATVEWTGSADGLGGSHVGEQNITALLSVFLTRSPNMTISNVTQTIQPEGSYWVVISTFDFAGYAPVAGKIHGEVAAHDSFVHTGNAWLIAGETWNFLECDVSFFNSLVGCPN